MIASKKNTLGDMCTIIDCEHKTAPTEAVGIPLIRTPNIGKSRLILDNVQRISEKTYKLWTRRGEPKPGNLIMAREAPVGNVAIIPGGEKVCLGQRTVLIRVKAPEVNAYYLNYLLNSRAMNTHLNLLSNGATVGHLNVTDIRRLSLPPLPSISDQKKIAAILSAYDDLIENNQRRIALLEKMAEEIYREWFVRMRFPGHEKVKLESRPLRDFIQEYIGGDWGEDVQGSKFANPVYVIRGTDFDGVLQGNISSVPLRYVKNSSLHSRKLRVGDLIVENSVNHQSRTAGKSLLVTQHLLDLFGGDVICASFCKLIRPKNTKHSKLLSLNFRLLFEQGLFEYFQNVATNGIANLQAERLLDRHLIFFHESIDLQILDSFDTSLLARVQANLRQTRDQLLPRLISGKLSVENLDIRFPPSMEEMSDEV